MAWFRPALETLIKRNQADVESSIPGTDAKVRRSNLNVIAKIISACAHGLYGYIAYQSKQIFPDSADTKNLDRHASLWLTVPRKAASYAVGQVVLTGTNGILIDAGTVLMRSDGLEYATDADVTISAGQAIADVTALTAGQTGNAIVGTTLSLASPIAGINSAATVHTTAMTGGSDQEENTDLSSRVVKRIQNPPHGGAKHDYELWALEVPGVTRAWVYPQELGGGTVTVRFVRDDDASLIPDAGEVVTVQDYIDERRTVTAKGCYVVAPIASPINFSIEITPDTAAVRAAVEAELMDLLQRESIPGSTILITHIHEAVSIAAGEQNFVMTVPNADVTNATGYMATLGVITWL